MEGSEDSAGRAVQETAAAFLAKLKSRFRASEGAIDLVVKEVNQLSDLHLGVLKEILLKQCALQDGYLTLQKVFSVIDSLKGQSLFEGVQSQPYLDSFIAHRSTDNNPFGLRQIIFDYKVVYTRGVAHKVPKDFAYFPPFLPQLQQLLNCKDVLHCVDNPRTSEDGVFRSVTDGYFYRYHFLVREHGNKVLSIILHMDDVEYADPCKSKTKKHKLRMYYWCLGNIYPELRSVIQAMNLLCIARYEVAVKYGTDEILKYFVEDMKKLGKGVMLTVNGSQRLFHGLLQFVAADIPAAANLGGFKESHFALRPCRMCMCSRLELCNHFTEDERLLRRLAEHNKYVDEVTAKTPVAISSPVVISNISLTEDSNADHEEEEEEPDVTQLDVMTFADHANPSVNYGINSKSILADLPGFDVTKCFPYDIMHVLFEGVAELICRVILKELCTVPQPQEEPSGARKRKRQKPKLSLDYVNQIIQEACDFGHLQVSKPSPIQKSHLKSKLKQSASQMIVLVHVLPIIAANNISQEKMDLLGQAIKIIALAMSFEVNMQDADDLASCIVTFGENFARIYPEYRTLKLHCLRHFKMQIMLHGPLRQQSCFRFESMHREFTRLVDVINNMKNIEFSLTSRHLTARNSEIMNGKTDGTFLYKGDILRKRDLCKLSALSQKDVVLETFPDFSLDDDVSTVDTFVKHGRCWKKDVIISLPNNQEPSFGIIVNIYLINGQILFMYNHLKVNHLSQVHAFEIQRRDHAHHCVKLSELKLKFPILRFTVHFGVNNTKSFLVTGSVGFISA